MASVYWAAEPSGLSAADKVKSRTHDQCYHKLYNLSAKNTVFILNKLRNRSNGLVRERKQRSRAHWRREKCRKANGGRERA